MHSKARVVLGAIVITFVVSGLALAQSDNELTALQAEINQLRAGQEQMKNDLTEIKRLLQQGARPAAAAPGQPAFRPADVEIGGSAVMGDQEATITMVGFSDYQCPFCSRHAQTVLPELVRDYVNSGKVKVVMRENPIESIHPLAMDASQAALCAAEQGKYWEMHDVMFENQQQLSVDNLKGYAKDLGMVSSKFDFCLDSKKYTRQIRTDLAEAARLGISGTPSFVIGLTDPDDSSKAHVTKYIRGAQSYAQFQAIFDELLASND